MAFNLQDVQEEALARSLIGFAQEGDEDGVARARDALQARGWSVTVLDELEDTSSEDTSGLFYVVAAVVVVAFLGFIWLVTAPRK